MSSVVKASKPVMRPAHLRDFYELAHNLRHEDALEIFHSSGLDPVPAVLRGYYVSDEAYTVTLDNKVVLIVGIAGIKGSYGVPWMLATDLLKDIRKQFLRGCGDLRDRWLAEYKHMENMVWVENQTHVQWLKWLGFTFDPPKPHGKTGELFQRFYMKEQ